MEPDIMPLHSSSPPPLDGDDEGELGSEEDDFGDFSVGMSCSPDVTEPPSTLKPAAHQPSCSFNRPFEHSQPTPTVNLESGRPQTDVEGQDCDAESLHLTNGYAEGESGARGASCSPKEETGFADFTVFTEQTAHPWCCGFSPADNTELWDGRVGGTDHSVGGRVCDSGQGVIMESEPRSHCARQEEEHVCTTLEHCENRGAAAAPPSQDHLHPQEAAAAVDFPRDEEESDTPGDTQRGRRRGLNSLQTSELQDDEEAEDGEKSVCTIPRTFSPCEAASDDLPSLSDDLSFEGVSADLEPNVSSLTSHDDHTDWDRTDDDDEDSFDLSPSDSQNHFQHCNQHATQETSATSNQPQSGTNTGDQFADFTARPSERRGDREHVQTADEGVPSLGNLPPSDSFADFCSAPTQGDGDGSWAEFKDQSAQVEGKPWTEFREPISSLQTDGGTEEEEEEEEEDRAGQYGGSRTKSCQPSLSRRVQQLLRTSFPEVTVPAVEGGDELLALGAVLQTQNLPESEEATRELGGAPWIQLEMLWSHQDVHGAVGLQFQWAGSHTNRTLLSCLGVDTRNIVFMGTKKQPVTLPAFASGLGMLQPTKDSVSAVGSPGHTAVTAHTRPGPRDGPDRSAPSGQEELPPRQLDWSSRGLSSSQDGCSALNLDYFGPEEESRSSSSSISPPPGVDRELYELTVSTLETSADSSLLQDTLNRLMAAAEKTSISVRKPLQDEELSAEAATVIAGLPDLCFMQAKVLMFPSVLVPKACGSPE